MWACRKDPCISFDCLNKGPAGTIDSVKLTHTINSQIRVINSPKNNTFYLVVQVDSNNFTLLVKLDSNLKVIYEKPLYLGSYAVKQLVPARDVDGFYIVSTTGLLDSAKISHRIEAYVFLNEGFKGDCEGHKLPYRYEYNSSFYYYTSKKVVNNIKLQKFNSNGDLLWTANQKGDIPFSQTADTDKEGNVYLFSYVIDSAGWVRNTLISGSVPYYYLNVGNADCVLSKYNAEGGVLFKKVFTAKSHFGSRTYLDMWPGMALSKNSVYVYASNRLFIFDHQGNIISDKKPFTDDCYHSIANMKASPLGRDAVLHSFLNEYPEQYLFVKMNQDIVNTNSKQRRATSLITVDTSGTIYYEYDYNIYKYHQEEQLIKQRKLNEIGRWDGGIGVVDKYNTFHLFQRRIDGREPSTVFVYRFDKNGNYQ